VEFLKFGDDPVQGGRSDKRYFGDLSGEYRFVSWLAATAQLTMLIDDTNFVFKPVTDVNGLQTSPNPAKFTAFEGWLGLRAFY
jgi:hypothetical protein